MIEHELTFETSHVSTTKTLLLILTKSYFLTKFYNISQHSPALLTRSLQFWLDFSSIVHLFDQVFEMLREKASQLNSAGHRKFSAELVEYAERQWRTGLFTKQDWNLFNINVLMVPATNNGNEVWCTCIFNFFVKKMGGKKLLINISLKPQGTNGRLYIDFGLHPNFWKFLRCCAAVFLRAETDIRELLFASNSFKNILFLFLLPLLQDLWGASAHWKLEVADVFWWISPPVYM